MRAQRCTDQAASGSGGERQHIRPAPQLERRIARQSTEQEGA